MKKLPDYLEKILDFLSSKAEKHGIMKKKKAYMVFKSELINDSLTAKANPQKKS